MAESSVIDTLTDLQVFYRASKIAARLAQHVGKYASFWKNIGYFSIRTRYDRELLNQSAIEVSVAFESSIEDLKDKVSDDAKLNFLLHVLRGLDELAAKIFDTPFVQPIPCPTLSPVDGIRALRALTESRVDFLGWPIDPYEYEDRLLDAAKSYGSSNLILPEQLQRKDDAGLNFREAQAYCTAGLEKVVRIWKGLAEFPLEQLEREPTDDAQRKLRSDLYGRRATLALRFMHADPDKMRAMTAEELREMVRSIDEPIRQLDSGGNNVVLPGDAFQAKEVIDALLAEPIFT